MTKATLISSFFLTIERSYVHGRLIFLTFVAEAEKEEALQRIQEADSAANKAVEAAIQLRQRAQTLMANANLAVYKSIMALRIAESLQLSQSPDLSSCLLESEGDV